MNESANQQSKAAIPRLPGRKGQIFVEKPKDSGAVVARLWKYLARERAKLFFIFFLLLINTGSTIAGSYLLRPIINHYIIPKNFDGFFHMIVWLISIYLVGFIAGFVLNRLMITVAQKTIAVIRAELFSKMQRLPLNFFDSNHHGDLMSRFTNDMDNVSDSLNTSVIQLLTSTITLLGIFALMIYISPLLTMVTLVVVPLMLYVASRIIKKSKRYFSDQQKELGAVNGYVEELITGQKVVKVFCYESRAGAEFESINEVLRQKSTQAQLYSGVMMPVIQNLNTINFALTATVGGVLAIFRGLDLGGLAAFLQYSRQFGRPVNEISSQYNSLQSAMAGAERIFQIMDEIPEIPDEADAAALTNVTGQVRFEGVYFSYDPGKPILTNINIEAKVGQKIALVGSTGAGKSTIMNLLPRFYDIQSGSISIDGIDLQKIQRNSLRQSLAMVLQDTHLFTGTVRENIRYGRLEATDDEVKEASVLAGSDSFIMRLPAGYDTVLENDGGNLSQGQRQLLNIARATITKPAILILDEATSSIDTRTELIIQQGMDHLMKGRTSFVIAHRLSTIRNADEILVLENGRIIERGDHASLLKLRGKYYELYTGQFD